jgi:hypothetical protein
MTVIAFDQTLFEAKIFHGLKSLLTKGETLPPRFLEITVCQAFGFDHVGDSTFYADGVRGQDQLSVKTRTLNPICLKRKLGRDFQTDPEKFIGPHHTPKQSKWTAGIEIVQRRQQLDFKNDSTENSKKVGTQCLKGFNDNVIESYKKFNTSVSHEVIVVHGYNKTNSSYIVSLFWQEYKMLDASTITWVREGPGVSGYLEIDGFSKKICERINGNAKREATCFKEYKDLTKYEYSATIKLPIPEPWPFNKEIVLSEINDLKEPEYESPFSFAK